MRKKMSEETIAKLRANIAKAREAKAAKKALGPEVKFTSEGLPEGCNAITLDALTNLTAVPVLAEPNRDTPCSLEGNTKNGEARESTTDTRHENGMADPRGGGQSISGGGQVPAETPDKVEDPAFPEAEDVPHINTPPESNLGGGIGATDGGTGVTTHENAHTADNPTTEGVEITSQRSAQSSSVGIVGWKTGWPKVVKP